MHRRRRSRSRRRSQRQQPQPQPQPAPRSTPVGHASGDLAAPRRSPAPDPRRMTMFGHVSHFGIESPTAPAPAPATAPAPTATPAPLSSRSRGANARAAPPRHQPSANAHAPAWETPTQPDPLRLADYLRRQAAQPPAVAAWPAADEPDARGRWTIPIVVAAVGIAALASVVIAIKTGEKPGPGMTSVPPSAPPSLSPFAHGPRSSARPRRSRRQPHRFPDRPRSHRAFGE